MNKKFLAFMALLFFAELVIFGADKSQLSQIQPTEIRLVSKNEGIVVRIAPMECDKSNFTGKFKKLWIRIPLNERPGSYQEIQALVKSEENFKLQEGVNVELYAWTDHHKKGPRYDIQITKLPQIAGSKSK